MPGDTITLALTAFEARTDMIERTLTASNGAPRATRVKKTEEKMGGVVGGSALHSRIR